MGHDPGQFLLPVGHENHAGMEKDIAARHRKGVHGGIFDDVKLIPKRLGPHLGYQCLSYMIDIRGEEGVFYEGNLLLQLQEKLFADLLLSLDG